MDAKISVVHLITYGVALRLDRDDLLGLYLQFTRKNTRCSWKPCNLWMYHDVKLEIWIVYYMYSIVRYCEYVWIDLRSLYIQKPPSFTEHKFGSCLCEFANKYKCWRTKHKQFTSEILKRYCLYRMSATKKKKTIWLLSTGKTCMNDPWKSISCFHYDFGLRPRGFHHSLSTVEVEVPKNQNWQCMAMEHPTFIDCFSNPSI